jgi:hypothetical protein
MPVPGTTSDSVAVSTPPGRRTIPGGRTGLLAVVLLLLGVLVVPGPAQAEPGEGDAALGTIAGTVTDPGGDPLEGATVTIRSEDDWAETTTGEDGTYEMSVRAGHYPVEFIPPEGTDLAAEFYDDTYGAPQPVQVVADTTTTGIDAQLEVGATISGTVTDDEGAPVAGVDVSVWSWWNSWPGYGRYAETDATGAYEVVGLPPGYAVVRAFPSPTSGLSSEYFENAFAQSQATPILLALGGASTGIDFELGPPGTISGTVTDPSGNPVAGAEVYAQTISCCEGDWAVTGPDGTYTLEVSPGDYVVSFDPPFGTPWLPERFDDVHGYSNEPTIVPVGEGEAVAGIDAQFDLGGTVSGRVTGLDGRGAGGVLVELTSTAPPFESITAVSSPGGVWATTRAPAGTYTVAFHAGHASEWYDDQLRPGGATTITVTAGEATTGIDASLEAIVFGQEFEANGTRVLAQCQSGDVSSFTFTVDGFDAAGGVTGGTIDFGDGTDPFAFDSTGDSVTHTYTWEGSSSTGPAFEATVTLTGAGDPSDSFTIVPGATACLATATPTFTDVPTSHLFFEDIECLVELGVTNGFEDGTFRPGQFITRAAVVSWLWRLAGEPTPDALPEFSDVPESHPFAEAIAWATEADITAGYPDGTFRPGNSVTRGAVAAWMHRYQFEPGAQLPSGFTDVPDSHPFAEAIAWLADVGVTEGYPDGTFRPGQAISRGGLAVWICALSALPPQWEIE